MTEEIKIDPITGLPELPEGFFWEVEEHESGMPVISIGGRKSLTWVDEDGREENPHSYSSLFGASYRYHKVLERTDAPRLYVARKTGKTKEGTVDVPLPWILGEWGLTRKKEETFYEVETFHTIANAVDKSGNFDWTEKSVALVARNVYAEWRERVQKQTRKAKLIGSYPPKRLSVESN